MKFIIGTAALFLILTSAPAFAQDEPKPQQQEEHKPQDSKAPVPEKAPPEKPAAAQPKEKQAPPEKSQPKPQTDEKQKQQEQKTQEQQKTQQAQAHKSAPAQNGGNARRIPDDKFRAHFGAQHHFRPARGNNGRFQYGGYWFVYSDPWPTAWSYDDDCYIEDDGGVYYLIDAMHPDLRIVLVVEVS